MRLLIFGANGATGRQLIKQALAQGHEVTAFARRASAPFPDDRLFTVQIGDACHYQDVARAVVGQDAILSALGLKPSFQTIFRQTTLLSAMTKNIIAAMEAHGVKRLICQTAIGIGDSKGQGGWVYNTIDLPLFLRNMYADKERQEQFIRASSLDWVIVRPSALIDGPRTGAYKVNFSRSDKSIRYQITYADVADFMVKQVTDNTFLRATPAISA